MPQKKIVIKKYENRRLYDMTNRRYINLDEIAQLVREGHEVTVSDAVTGEDLTRLILAQIVVENAKTPNSVFPVEILRQMIVVSGQATQDSAVRYTKMMMEMYQKAFRSVPASLNPFSFMQMPWSAQTEAAPPESSTDAPSQGVASQAQQQGNPTPDPSSEVEALRRRVEQLESLTKRAPKKSTKPKSKR